MGVFMDSWNSYRIYPTDMGTDNGMENDFSKKHGGTIWHPVCSYLTRTKAVNPPNLGYHKIRWCSVG